MAEKKEAKAMTVRDLATKLKLEPKRLRAIMRANGMHAKDGRYEWKQDDAALDKIGQMIVKERRKQRRSESRNSPPVYPRWAFWWATLP